MATDVSSPIRPVLALFSDPRAAQFWDKDHLIAADIKRQLNGGKPACCEQSGFLWDLVTIYPKGERWESAAPQYDKGPIYKVASDLSGKLAEALKGNSASSELQSR